MLAGLLLNVKFWLSAAAAVAISLFVWHYSSLTNTLEESKKTIVEQSAAIINQEAAIASIKNDAKKQQDTTTTVDNKFNDATAASDDTKDKLNKSANGNDRNLGKMIDRHPELLERIINQGTADSLECIRIASGSREKEKDNYHANNQCPLLHSGTGTK